MEKELYAIGEDISLETTPEKMYAYVIRPEKHGEPVVAFQQEIIDVPKIKPDEVLILIKAVGVNYNGIWSALGLPRSPTTYHNCSFHITGSDASGIVWRIGSGINRNSIWFKEGDEIVIQCGQWCGQCPECNGGNPMLCSDQKIWGYETPFGSFAQFSVVKPYQILPKPKHLTWAEASSYMLVSVTAWRMLYGYIPHTLKPSQNILIIGASGGLGSAAIQIVNNAGANPIAIVSSEEKGEYCLKLGAKTYINKNNYKCWGKMPEVGSVLYAEFLNEARTLGKDINIKLNKKIAIDTVFEHAGENTFPVSCYLAKKGGMIVYCGATSGFNMTFDAAYVWTRQKRIQGSHFGSLYDALQVNQAVQEGKIKPFLEKTFKWRELPQAHQLVYENKQPPGKIAIVLE